MHVRARRGLGYLPQEASIFRKLTVEQNIEAILEIRKDLDDPPRQIVDPVHGRPSVTHWRVIQRCDDRTRLELAPVTGRSHQLRLHLKEVGHPILGDDLYAPPVALAKAPEGWK